MHLFITIVAFLAIFSLLILIHECGHFFVAKWHGIKVEEFGFGLPPKLWGKKFGETLYSLNWIPFGGFVRMLGEDARDKKALKSARSFIRKTKWQRTQIVCAGVVMNFLLAWILFSVGFSVGMQPLMVSSDDFFQGIREGGVQIQQVDPAVPLEELAGRQITDLPRVTVYEFDGSIFQPGDIILNANGGEVFFSEEWEALLNEADGAPLEVEWLRSGEVISATVSVPYELFATGIEMHRTLISEVLPDSPAARGGLQQGDLVVAVNGTEVIRPEAVVWLLEDNTSATITYDVEREGVLLSIEMTPNEDGRVGVLLSEIHSSEVNPRFSYYDGALRYEVLSIEDIKYPVWEAPWQALIEMKRIGGVTLVMLGRVFGSIFVSGDVPEGVAGPVGIAQMTGLYVQEGFVALMRFTALLSLSLAVINIFPFPALDGGRLLFILIEAVRGKPVNTRVEGYIHTVGFLFLIAVILLVTFQDLQRLF